MDKKELNSIKQKCEGLCILYVEDEENVRVQQLKS